MHAPPLRKLLHGLTDRPSKLSTGVSVPSILFGVRGTVVQVRYLERDFKILAPAGVLLALDGLHPPSMGSRISFSSGKPKVTDGPFAEAKEVLGGYWMIQVKSKEEALEWASRCPASDNEVIELRQVQEISDFPTELQEIVSRHPELQ
jgi:hypothetical protein